MKEPKPCPFCGAVLEHRFHQCRALPDTPVMEYWKHERNGCFESGVEIGPEELAQWNRRDGDAD